MLEKVLDQKEIDALFRAAQGKSQEGAADEQEPRQITPLNLDQAGRISKNQVQSVSVLHDTFARNLTHSLGAHLRVILEVALVSVEQLSYVEFLQRLPEITYLAAMGIQPLGARGAVQMDLSLAFPVVDLLLGGRGKAETQAREITEIEEHVIESVVKIICRELQATWQPVLELQFSFEQRQQQTQIMQLMPPNEKTLSLIFEIRTSEARGLLNLVFPTAVSGALLRKLSQQWSYQKRQAASEGTPQLREKLLDCPFPAELTLPPTPVRIRELLELKAGQVLSLQHGIEDSIIFSVSGKKLFSAYPTRCKDMRGAQIQQRLQISVSSERERRNR